MELAGACVLVTGGGAGIGAAIATGLAGRHARVLIADIAETAGRATAARIGGEFVLADMATDAGVRTALDTARQRLGRLDVLVNNAGGVAADGDRFPRADVTDWSATLDLNLRGPMLAIQHALELMNGPAGGAVVNIASIAGLGTVSHGVPEYAAAKAALVRLTGCLAPLREQRGVRVNCICPDLVDTPASRRSRASLTPAERAAEPALDSTEIADATIELLCDDSLAGRVMVCRAGQPRRLLPLVHWRDV